MSEPVLLIATANEGKFREIAAELAGASLQLRSLAEMPSVEACIEDGETFMANAEKKASYYARHYQCAALADDSGLEVDALNGGPGVMSARYAGKNGDDAANNEKLLEELADVPPARRTARFRCAMAVADRQGRILARTEGVVEGVILYRSRGQNGFGYDPLFMVPELAKTTAEISPEHKNRISHRGQAVRAMREKLKDVLGDLQAGWAD